MFAQLKFAFDYLSMHLRRDEGATAVEYGVMVALIIAVIVGAVATLGGYVNDAFGTVNGELGP